MKAVHSIYVSLPASCPEARFNKASLKNNEFQENGQKLAEKFLY